MKSSLQAPRKSGQAIDNAEAKHFQPNKFVKLTKKQEQACQSDKKEETCQADKYGSEKKN